MLPGCGHSGFLGILARSQQIRDPGAGAVRLAFGHLGPARVATGEARICGPARSAEISGVGMNDGASPWRRLLDGWMQIALRLGEAQTLVLLGLVYTVVIGPAALVARALGSDFLGKHGAREAGSAWREADSRPPSLENLKQPF
jgi:hypothetical protein